MDVKKNPGPAIALNSSLSSLVDSRMVNFNSRHESSPLSLSLHLQMRFNCYANPQLRLVYSRDELFSIRFESPRLKPCPRIVNNLKMSSLLRYRGKRTGRSKEFHWDNRAIRVLNRPRYTPTFRHARVRIFPSLTFCDSPRPPSISHSKPSTVSFALFNARSVRNKWLPIKDYIVSNDIDIFAL